MLSSCWNCWQCAQLFRRIVNSFNGITAEPERLPLPNNRYSCRRSDRGEGRTPLLKLVPSPGKGSRGRYIRSDNLTQKEITILYSYIYNNTCRLEDEVRQLQANLRTRKIDVVDCFELACSMQQLQTFTEVTGHILAILNLRK